MSDSEEPLPRCPVEDSVREWIESRMAWLIEQFGLDRLNSVDVILPNSHYFPDEYNGTEEDARLLLDRVCDYMELDSRTVELHLYQDRNVVHDEHGRLGTAGVYDEASGMYRVWIEASNLGDPLGLVATMAHELAHVHLLGHRRVSENEEDHEPLTDLLTVFLGMGIFTANSVLREKSWVAGAWSGWTMGRSGYLSMPMYGYALALFAWVRREPNIEWADELRPDVRSAFDEGQKYLAETNGSTFDSHGRYRASGAVVSVPSFVKPAADEVPPDEIGEPEDDQEVTPVCCMCGEEVDPETAPDSNGHPGLICHECHESIAENYQEIEKSQMERERDTRIARGIFVMAGLVFVGILVTVILAGLLFH